MSESASELYSVLSLSHTLGISAPIRPKAQSIVRGSLAEAVIPAELSVFLLIKLI